MTTRRSKGTPELTETLDLDPVLDFMRLLWSVEHGLQSTSKRMEATLGITGPQRLVLRIVTVRPGLSAGELARIVHLHPSTITGILQRLIRKGLLRRERDRRDNRRVRLHCDSTANRFVAASTGTVESAVTRALVRIPKHRVRQAREVLSAIAEALADDRGKSAAASTRQRRKATEPRVDQPGARVSRRNRGQRLARSHV
jgi:MarR family transcriptional regulator, organic hydroperoxide resistance regulator